MTPNSTDSIVFITRQPSWEAPVEIELQQETAVFTAHAGLEERQRRRVRSRVELSYAAALTPAECIGRDTSAVNEANNACIVPIWTERALTTSGIVANVVGIDRTPDPDWFQPGDYAYLYTRELGGQFRLITAAGADSLTFEALIGSVAFLAGSTIYPCRKCSNRGAEWQGQSRNTARETFRFTSL